MRLTVAKFGGSSVNSADKLSMAYSTVSSLVERGDRVVTVVSAVRGVTDTLQDTIERIDAQNFDEVFAGCEEKLKNLHSHTPLSVEDLSVLERDLSGYVKSGKKPWLEDQILVKGEQLFAENFASGLNRNGVKTELLDFGSPHFPTVVRGYFGNARIDLEGTREMCQRLLPHFYSLRCICVPGFGGVDRESGRVKTLRRGGSDAAATALGYGLSSDSLLIITDTAGIKRAYTKSLTDAPTIPEICVEELRDAGVYGAKVPNEAAMRPLMLHCPQETAVTRYDNVYGERTMVVKTRELDAEHPVELASQREIIIYEFNGENMHSQISHLESDLDIKLIDFISLGGGDYTRKLVIPSDQEPYVDESLTEHRNLDVTKSRGALVGVVGKSIERAPGIIARMGGALARKGINIYYQFDVSPISCGVIVDKSQSEEAVELLYDEFKLSTF